MALEVFRALRVCRGSRVLGHPRFLRVQGGSGILGLRLQVGGWRAEGAPRSKWNGCLGGGGGAGGDLNT